MRWPSLVLVALAVLLAHATAFEPDDTREGVSDLGDGAVARLVAAPSQAPTVAVTQQSLASKMAQIKCEVAVSSASSKKLKIQAKIELQSAVHLQAQNKREQAQHQFNLVEREASTAEMQEFGLRYAALKTELKLLSNRAKADRRAKQRYIDMVGIYPDRTKKLSMINTELEATDQRIKTAQVDIATYEDELEMNARAYSDLKHQIPIDTRMTEDKYMAQILPKKSENAVLEMQLSNQAKKNQAANAEVPALIEALKPPTAETVILTQNVSEIKERVKAQLIQTVAVGKKFTVKELGLADKFASIKEKLIDGSSAFMESKTKSRETDMADMNGAEQKEKIKVLNAEETGEQAIENAEQGHEQHEDGRSVYQKQHDALEAELKNVRIAANAKTATAEEEAAQELAKVQARYAKMLEAHKRSSKKENAAVVEASDPFASDKKEFVRLNQKLKAAIPDYANSVFRYAKPNKALTQEAKNEAFETP